MSNKKISTIDEYIQMFDASVQSILQEIRHGITKLVPTVSESISYGIPTFKLNGKPLVHFAAFKSHIGLYPPVPDVFLERVSQYAGPKGNLKFPLSEKIPIDLILEIVAYRLELLRKVKLKDA